MTNESRINYIL